MQPSKLAKRGYLLLYLAIIGFYLYGLGRFPLVGPDEPRYAEVAREMLQRRDLITPTLGGHVWFEKPPLLYWMMMASFRVFGVSEWAARLGPAVCGLLTIAAVYWLGRRLEKNDSKTEGLAFATGLVAASTLGIIVFSRGASSDIVLTMTVTWALVFFVSGEFGPDSRTYQLLLAGFYIFVGLSLLAKGLVGIVVPLGVITTYQLLRRQTPERRLVASLSWGLPLILIVSAVWYGPVIYQYGWSFISDFFIQHHVLRYVTNKYHHPQPFYHYLLIVPVMAMPWTPFLIASLAGVRRWQLKSTESENKVLILAIAWLIFPLAFFSLSRSKLPGYILPVLPAAALLAGNELKRCMAGERAFRAMQATGALLLLLCSAAIIYTLWSGNLSLRCALAGALPLFLAGIVAMISRWKRTAALLVTCGLLASIIVALNCGAMRIAQRESVRDLLALAQKRGYGSAPVYSLHDIDHTAEFYAAGRIAYASDGELLRFEGPDQVREAAMRENGPILVIVPVVYAYQLTQLTETRIELLGDNGRVAMVAVTSQKDRGS